MAMAMAMAMALAMALAMANINKHGQKHILVDSLTSIIEWIRADLSSMCDVDKYILIRQLEDFRFVLKEVLDENEEKLTDYKNIIFQLETEQEKDKYKQIAESNRRKQKKQIAESNKKNKKGDENDAIRE